MLQTSRVPPWRAIRPRRLRLQPLLCRVDHDRASLPEKQSFDFDKPKHRAVADASGIDLVDPAVIYKHHFQ